jgi:hypothetical protein
MGQHQTVKLAQGRIRFAGAFQRTGQLIADTGGVFLELGCPQQFAIEGGGTLVLRCAGTEVVGRRICQYTRFQVQVGQTPGCFPPHVVGTGAQGQEVLVLRHGGPGIRIKASTILHRAGPLGRCARQYHRGLEIPQRGIVRTGIATRAGPQATGQGHAQGEGQQGAHGADLG